MAEAATIARPYAKAVFMVAREAKALAPWSEALEGGTAILGAARVCELLTDPKLNDDGRVALFAGLGGSAIDAKWQNFIRLLAHNKRLEVMPEIAWQYQLLRAQYENELDVAVTSAAPLSDAHQAKLREALQKRFKRDVRMTTTVDATLLGGAVIRAGDLVIDGSINGRLQRLASDLTA